ncbi:MAG: ribonuclease P protein component [Clostridia bacterium]|nr:ribonuclease P protein component [Clostridia bacterium]
MKYGTICEHHLYSKAYSKGKKCVCPSITVYVLRDLHAAKLAKQNPLKQKYNRVGLSVPKKAATGAVGRNRVKRILREAYRLTEKKYNIRHGYLIVIASRAAANDRKTPEIEAELVRALKRLELLV